MYNRRLIRVTLQLCSFDSEIIIVNNYNKSISNYWCIDLENILLQGNSHLALFQSYLEIVPLSNLFVH